MRLFHWLYNLCDIFAEDRFNPAAYMGGEGV